MKREDLRAKFSQVVGVSKAEQILSEAENALGFTDQTQYTDIELRDLCEEIVDSYEGYIAEIANELRIHTQAQQRFDTLLENVPDPAVVVSFVDSEPVVQTANKEFETVFGYDRAAINGELLAELIVPPNTEYGMDLWLRDDRQAEREVTRLTADGEERTFLLRTAMETTMGGDVEGYGIYTDITGRIERERDLNTLKQLFSRVFRHNIRNELTVVKGHLSMLSPQATGDEIETSTETIRHATDRLLSHTEKARDIEKLVDADPTRIQMPLRELLQSAVDTQNFTEQDDVAIEISVPDVSVWVVDGSETALKNAIENAIIHNPLPVTVTISATVDDDQVRLRIADDGIGIAPNETEMLTSGEETPLSHGSGVGLWVINWYVEKSGGELSIWGGGSGTTVDITLQQADPSDTNQQSSDESSGSGMGS